MREIIKRKLEDEKIVIEQRVDIGSLGVQRIIAQVIKRTVTWRRRLVIEKRKIEILGMETVFIHYG